MCIVFREVDATNETDLKYVDRASERRKCEGQYASVAQEFMDQRGRTVEESKFLVNV